MSAPLTDPNSSTPPPPPPASADDPIQFDKVQYSGAGADQAGTAAPCAACKSPITDSYYEVNGQVVCPACKLQLQGAFTGGSKVARMIKAFIFGLIAAIISSIGYYFLCRITNREFAIATIAMGWFIGWAVHRGAGGRGGWFYIAAAVILTYASISFSYVPVIFNAAAEANASGAQVDADASFILRALAYVLALPVMSAMESPIMILIYGFGLWQAGKMNRRPHINVTGPYSTRGGMATAPAAGPIPDKTIL